MGEPLRDWLSNILRKRNIPFLFPAFAWWFIRELSKDIGFGRLGDYLSDQTSLMGEWIQYVAERPIFAFASVPISVLVVAIWAYLDTGRRSPKREVIANVYSGYVTLDEAPAGVGHEVMAKVGDYTSPSVTTNEAGYYLELAVQPPNDSYIGIPTEFYVDGERVDRTEEYMGGGHKPNYWNLQTEDTDTIVHESVPNLFEDLHAEGVSLRNRIQYQMSNGSEIETWIPLCHEWQNRLVEGVRPVSQHHARRLRTLNQFRRFQAPVSNPMDGLFQGIEHERWADIQNELLSRFEEFLDEHRQ